MEQKVTEVRANQLYNQYVGWFKKNNKQNEGKKLLSFKDWLSWAKTTPLFNADGDEAPKTPAPVVATSFMDKIKANKGKIIAGVIIVAAITVIVIKIKSNGKTA